MNKMISKLLLGVLFMLGYISADAQQVTLTATAGTAAGTFTTLKGAFDAINAGTHQGVIVISINANTTEGTTPANLNSSGAGAANYTSINIRPTVDGVSISGNPASGFGVIQLNGADNVTIDGDNPNTGGTNRNLSVINTVAATTTYSSVIRIATLGTTVTSADNIIIKNSILTGNASGRNASGNASTTGSENTTFGIYIGAKGSVTTPTAITSVSTSMDAATTTNNLLIDNNAINSCARGVAFMGASSTSSTGVTISNNIIGDQSTTLSGTPPFTTPTTTVYSKGIYVQGTNAITISGNTIKNILTYVATVSNAIELNSAIGSGTISITGNIINGVCGNAGTSGREGILISSAAGPYTVSGNTITNIQGVATGSAGVIGIDVATSSASATIDKNKVTTVYNRSTSTWNAYGVRLNGGNNITFQNNFISDINHDLTGGTSFSTTAGVFGLLVNSGNGHKIYHNSINLSGSMFGTPTSNALSAAFGILASTQTGIDVRNNIFSNTLTGGTTSLAHVSVCLPSGATNSMNLLWNNNAYFSGTTAASQGIAQVGTTVGTGFYLASNFNSSSTAGATNLRNYSSSLLVANTNNDNASIAFTTAAPFTSATDLHIPAATGTQMESGGASVGVTTDFDGDTRPGPTGSINGGGTAPDMGADEFDGAPPTPTITSLGTSSGCAGTQLVINGTNLTGTTAGQVKIGGTAVGSIVSNTGTVLTVVIGSGTTGVVTVQTSFGTATSAATFTVFPLPSDPGNPTSNSPQCVSPGVTLTRSGSPTGGDIWYWQTSASGTSTVNSGTTFNVTTSGTYYIRAQSTNGCWSAGAGSLAVTINATPSALTVTPSTATICNGVIQTLTASGGTIPGATAFTETFETFPGTNFSSTGANVTAASNTTYFSQGSKSVFLTHTTTAATTATTTNSYQQQSNLDLSGYGSAQLSFSHICALEGSTTTWDAGYVEYSTNGGTSWTVFPTSSYAGTGTLITSENGNTVSGVIFSTKSYSDWISTFSSASSTPGTGPATSLWKTETINIPVAALTSQFRIRFQITQDGTTSYYGWLLDNIQITGSTLSPVTWDPVTDLYTDPGATAGNGYAGQNLRTVYAKPTVNRTYTATATNGTCTSTGTSAITVNNVPGCVTGHSPADNTTGVAVSGTTLSWTAGSGTTTGYDVYFSTNQSLVDAQDNSVKVSSNQAGTSYITGSLTGNTDYYWRVVGRNSCGGATGCATLKLTTVGCAAPTVQASNITFSSISFTQMNVNWTNGDGAKRVVIINTSNSFTDPTDGSDPSANSVYGGSGEQVVYNGSANTFTVTGLIQGTTYWFKVYEANCSGIDVKFITSAGSNNPNSQATLTCAAPTTQASAIIFSSVTANGLTSSWTNGNGQSRVVIMNTTNSFTSPADGTEPTANTVYGSGEQVVYNGTGSTVSVTGLSCGTTYFFRVYEKNCSGVDSKYQAATATNNPNSQVSASSSVKTWIGAGAGGAGTDFNAAANWSPATAPSACDDIVITTTTAAAILVTANVTVNSIALTNNTNAAVTLSLDAQANTLTTNGSFSANLGATGSSSTTTRVRIGNGGSIVINGNANLGNTGSSAGFVIVDGSGGVTSTGTMTFKGNVSFGDAYGTGSSSIGTFFFDGTGTQSISTGPTFLIGFPGHVQIGNANSPTVTLAGPLSCLVTGAANNLTVSKGILNLSTFTFNKSTTSPSAAGGTFSVAAGATLRLSGTSGGQTGSNFPLNFTTATPTLNATSTVEYYGGSQTIYAAPAYGNLTLSTSGSKSATSSLTIAGNLLINSPATFAAGTSLTHNLAGNWTNNGTFSFTTASIINFNGSNNATISGSSATVFGNITVNKGTSTSTVLEANGVGAISNTGTLTLTNGLYRLTSSNSSALPGGGITIAATAGIEINGGTLNGSAGTITNNGLFRLISGTATVGTGQGNALLNNSGSTCDIQGGTYIGASRIQSTGGTFTQSGGAITLCTVSNTNAAIGNFDIGAAANLNITNGTITIRNPNTNATPFNSINISAGAGTKTITGGTFQIGDASTASNQTFLINSAVALNNFTINSTNSPVVKLVNNLSIGGVLTMNGGNIDGATNSKDVIVTNNAAAAIVRTAGYVNYNLKRSVGVTGIDYLWPVGFSTNYTPATYNFTNLTAGDLNVMAVSGDEPNLASSSIDATKSVNMYWSTTASAGAASSNYAGNYAWPAGLNDAGVSAGSFVYGKFNAGWTYPAVSGTPTTTTLAFTGAFGFSNHAIGNCKGVTTANAGTNQTICSSTASVTLAANAVSGSETGAWSITSGPSSNLSQFSSVTNPAASFTPDGGPGTYVLTWTLSISAPCVASSSSNVTITVNPAATVNAGTAANICTGSPYTLTGASIGGGATTGTWTIISTTGTMTTANTQLSDITATATPGTVTFTPIAGNKGTVTLRLTTSNPGAPCAAVSADVVLTVDGYTWTGDGNNTNWADAANWPTCGIPASGADFTIATAAGKSDPVLDADRTVGSITFATGTTLGIGSNTLTVNGTITGDGTLSGSGSSNLTIAGTAGTISFTSGSRILKNLVLNNNASATLGSVLDITAGASANTEGSVTTGTGAVLTTGGNLTLKSDANGTARIATSAGSISGAVTVERYLTTGSGNNRAWRILSVPVKGQSFHNGWQEGQAAGANGNPGYGTNISSNIANATNPGNPGFDFSTPGNSLMAWNQAIQNWQGGAANALVNSTSNTSQTTAGWMLYVRGDRSQGVSTNNTGNAITTTLRTKGAIYEGSQAAISVPQDKAVLVGNVYASAIDFNTLGLLTGDVDSAFYVWDPKLLGTYGLGAFQTFAAANNWEPVPGGGSYGTSSNTIIQSGLAFFVRGSSTGAGGAINLTEAAKTSGSAVVQFTAGMMERFKTSLFSAGATSNLADGNTVVFNNAYSNAVDSRDAIKMDNIGERLAASRDGKLLSLETRQPVIVTDTIYLNMQNLKQQAYRFVFNAENMDHPGLLGKLIDSYTGTSSLVILNGETNYNFTVNADPGSSAANRFKVVFYSAGPLPVTFTDIKAYQTPGQNKNVTVEWKVSNQLNIEKYEVERSTDGSTFAMQGMVAATGTNGSNVSYNWLDVQPITGMNYYRVRSIGAAGDIKYSSIVKVKIAADNQAITVYPNPVTNKTVSLKFTGMEKGAYLLTLVNELGQTVFSQQLVHSGVNSIQSVKFGSSIAKGNYYLRILKPDNSAVSIPLVISE